MAVRTYQKPTDDPIIVFLNHKVLGDINITIQNNTDGDLTVQVTAQDPNTVPQNELVFSDPYQGSLDIQIGEFGCLTNPYTALKCSGLSNGTISIVEAY